MKTDHPYADMLDAITRAFNSTTPLRIATAPTDELDIVFTAKLTDLGITTEALRHPFCRTHLFANLLGTLLVESRLIGGFDKIISHPIFANARKYRHRNFGLKTVNNDTELLFQFNASLLVDLFNAYLSKEIDPVAKELPECDASKVTAEKTDDENPIIASYGNDTSLKLIIRKSDNNRHTMQRIISAVLDHYGVKKCVSITDGFSQVEVSLDDK